MKRNNSWKVPAHTRYLTESRPVAGVVQDALDVLQSQSAKTLQNVLASAEGQAAVQSITLGVAEVAEQKIVSYTLPVAIAAGVIGYLLGRKR